MFIFGIGFRKEIKFMKENVSRIFAETFAQEDWKTCDYELGKEGVDFFLLNTTCSFLREKEDGGERDGE